MRPALIAFALLIGGCDRTPSFVKDLEAKRLPAQRELVAKLRKECIGGGPQYKPSDWGPLATDPGVLNIQVSCKTVKGLGMAVQLPMKPTPPGDKSGRNYLVGVSRGTKDAFPREQAVDPSFITAEPDAVDLVVASGHPDDPDFTEVRVAYKVTRGK
jgi:hypothetical protein